MVRKPARHGTYVEFLYRFYLPFSVRCVPRACFTADMMDVDKRRSGYGKGRILYTLRKTILPRCERGCVARISNALGVLDVE